MRLVSRLDGMSRCSCVTGKCRKASNKFYDSAAIMVEDDGEPHAMNFFEETALKSDTQKEKHQR